MNNVSTDMDYQDTIRAAALAFLERHQGEHLADLSALLNRTISHLVSSFNVAEPVAIKLASLAQIELMEIAFHQRLDLNYSTDTVVVIKDPIRGCCWSVPVYLIYEHLIAAGRGTRLTPAT